MAASDHSHKKRKDSLETRTVHLIFSLELQISRVAVQNIHQTVKNGYFSEELLSENDFKPVLASFCCYDHDAKASEAVQKFTKSEKWLVCKKTSDAAKKAAEIAQIKRQSLAHCEFYP